ncbi:hypothetical protein E2320_000427 [Naja naja]|nr:hypothetical protein E2320_000427 [Naja naja]
MPLQLQPTELSSCPADFMSSGNAPTDMELMTSMMQKIASLEWKVKSQAQAIQEKNKKIRELEEQIKTLQKRTEKTSTGATRVEELETLCLQLQRQVWEMELFLNDYGLIWVGEDPDSLRDLESQEEEESLTSKTLWKPGEAIISETPINFDLIFKNLKDLNVLAGEGPKLTMEEFLNKLPKSLVRDGQVIDIREDLKKTLQGLDGAQSHEVVLVETPSLTALRKRLEGKQKTEGPGTNISTLRIKSEDGEKTYIVKMSFTETIGDLRQHLAQNRGEALQPYEILSTFPLQVYNNDAMSLEECGLVPNAFLLLRKKLSPTKAGGE